MKLAVSFSSAGHKRAAFATPTPQAIEETRLVVYDVPVEDSERSLPFPDEKMATFINHVYLYADVLFSWKMFDKRLELLRSISQVSVADSQHEIGSSRSSFVLVN
ncbi:WD-REPEATS-REGION domain-containing protein [Mycena chlorophos]|uniref:WD-REPEATS-REGION domain-containing protein n=1 Tax=Mycena chlorophos TaxID=658473 RepID=A0A8H6T0F9_MYCCL|nr:WD-REPEATS-REGION domain-containing protein [Mycena chlorophos]